MLFRNIGKYCNDMTGVAILKMRRDSHRFVSTVLPFITNIGLEQVQLHTLRTTGTLQQAYKHLKVSHFYISDLIIEKIISNESKEFF